jgi:superoxide dismutase, Fe-Mn family
MSTYTLPKLRYEYSALEPYISKRVLELHHDAHHGAYVKNANLALAALDKAREAGDLARLPALEKALAFNLSGHIMHSIFWQNMTPQGGGQPQGDLARTIDRDFGSFDKFKRQLTQAANTDMGSGWAALVWEPCGGRLLTVQIHDHQSQVTQAGIPLLVLDAWEHAYYLQYENRKGEFFDAVWNVWNWRDVAGRFEAAKKLDLQLVGVHGS